MMKKTGLMKVFLLLDLILWSFVSILTGMGIIPFFIYPALMFCLFPILYVQVNFVKRRRHDNET